MNNLPENVVYLPEKPEKRHIDAIFSAWDHYGPGSYKRLLGTPEAQRIYAALIEESKKGQKGQKGQ